MMRVSTAAVAVALTAAGCAVDAAPSRLGLSIQDDQTRDVVEVRYSGGYVTAESLYGHGEISGPVRNGRRGRAEVRLPGGTWIECGRSCSETLRQETVDFWESRSHPSNPGPVRGYLRGRW